MRTQTHHRFLKHDTRDIPQIGDYLPLIFIDEKQTINDYITDYLLIVVLSTTCLPCKKALLVLDEYLQKNTINLVVLMDTTPESIEVVKAMFHPDTKIHKIDSYLLRTYFQGVPWGMCVNSEGQILSSYAFDNMEWFERIIFPIKELIEKS